MKTIKRILFLFISNLIISQTIHLQARPNIVSNNRGGMTGTHSQAAIINRGHNQNNAASQASVVSSVINQNNQTQDTQNQTSATPTQEQATDDIPVAPATIPDVNTSEPALPSTETNNSVNNTNLDQNIVPSTNTSDAASTQNQPALEPEAINKKQEETTAIKYDKKTIIPDQDAILKTLETINAQDVQNHILLTESSMQQLFNNFVYFKNFIVDNFTKEKMIRLCIEFIDQIYPKETIIAPQIIQETSQVTHEQSVEKNPAEENLASEQYQQEEQPAQDNSYQYTYDTNNNESDNQSYDNSQDTNQEEMPTDQDQM